MNKRVKQFLIFIGFLLAQAFLSRFIDFGPILFIAIYPLFIVTLSSDTSIDKIMLWAFAIGICTDLLSGQIIGLNSGATLVMSIFQPRMLRMVYRRGDSDNHIRPGLRELGLAKFSGYMLPLLAIHHIFYFLIEEFGFRFFLENAPRMAVSFGANVLLIYLIEYGIFYKIRR